MRTHKISDNYTQFASQNASQDFDIKREKNKRIKFTDITIKYLKTSGKRDIYWCEGMPGFGIRVSSNGNKTWIYMYRFAGKPRFMTLGKYPNMPLFEARIAYAEAVGKLKAENIDPGKEKVIANNFTKEAPTVEQFIELYAEYNQKKGKITWVDERRELIKNLVPYIGMLKMHQVKKKDLAPIFQNIVMKGNAPKGVRQIFAYTRHMFNVAVMWDYVEFNPCAGIKLDIKQGRRERHLSPKEVYLFWHGLDKVDLVPVMRLAAKFMLCTMTRGVEVRTMEWKHLDEKAGVWTIPRTKNAKMHRIHLHHHALEILREVKRFTGNAQYVFGATKKILFPDEPQKELNTFYRTSLCRVTRKIQSVMSECEPFHMHDLRRTAATLVIAMGCPRYWAKLLLNHTDHDVTGIYDQYAYDWEKSKGMEILDYVIDRIIASPTVDEVPSILELRSEIIEKGIYRKELHSSY